MSNINWPNDKEVAKDLIAAQSKECGMLGKIFGTREHAPTNIAAIALILLIILLAGLIFAPLPSDIERGALITAILSAITGIFGLLWGRYSGSDR